MRVEFKYKRKNSENFNIFSKICFNIPKENITEDKIVFKLRSLLTRFL